MNILFMAPRMVYCSIINLLWSIMSKMSTTFRSISYVVLIFDIMLQSKLIILQQEHAFCSTAKTQMCRYQCSSVSASPCFDRLECPRRSATTSTVGWARTRIPSTRPSSTCSRSRRSCSSPSSSPRLRKVGRPAPT